MALLLALCLTSLVLCASYVPPAELAQEGAAVQPAEAVQPARSRRRRRASRRRTSPLPSRSGRRMRRTCT